MIKGYNMETAKLFQNGRSQAVRLPKSYNFTGNDVFIQKVGETVILFPKDKVWETFLEGLNGFTDDFMANGREQPEMQEREGL
jgi:antitoxin VapB